MKNFELDEIKISEIVKTCFKLTKAEYDIFVFFLKNKEEEYFTEEVANFLKMNLSTIQRAVKKMCEQKLLTKRQSNLKGGGYLFIYKIKSQSVIKNILEDKLDFWIAKVQKELLNNGLKELLK